jgi:hypothetical protein
VECLVDVSVAAASLESIAAHHSAPPAALGHVHAAPAAFAAPRIASEGLLECTGRIDQKPLLSALAALQIYA